MPIEHTYEVQVTWTSERKGIMQSSVLDKDVEVATPPEFPKGMPGIWSPEHLFVAAVNSCLMTTFLAIAENSQLSFASFSSSGKGKLAMQDGKYMMTEIYLYPVLHIKQEADREKALRVLQKAEAACLISNSIKSSITFVPEIIIQS